jgi:hypothetical protein
MIVNNDWIKNYLLLFENRTRKIVYCSLLAGLSSILQASGGMGGPGFILSSFSSLPIILASLLSFREGVITYLTTISLLFIFQPTELVIFPFTTGLLGIVIGFSYRYFKNSLVITFTAGFALWIGVMILLYGFNFPVLGPGFSSSFHLQKVGFIFLFSLVYSWTWVKFTHFFVKVVVLTILKKK